MTVARRQVLVAAASASAMPAGLRAQTEERIEVAGCSIHLQLEPDFPTTAEAAIRRWVVAAAQAVAGYLGRFPVPQFELLVQNVAGAGIKGGTTYAEPKVYIRVRLGRGSTEAHFANDWILVHEMVHLAVPRVPRSQQWLHEGVATYVEGVARVRAGRNTAPRLWAELLRGLPQGQPQDGDRGLDHTPTWGRTYWGGALYCLLADVQMLRESGTRAGLREALQGVLEAGGSYAVAWPVQRILETADRAVGQHALMGLYGTMKDSSQLIDLPALWRQLGVSVVEGAAAELDDRAPLAAVRRAIA